MTVKIKAITSLSDVNFTMIEKKMQEDSKDKAHYVNNKELYAVMKEYHEYKNKCLAENKPIPPLPEKAARAIMQIARRRCNSPMFVGYSPAWKEEMIGNAILLAISYGHNFDPNKTNNPFAYFTQICHNAITEQLKVEKTNLYVVYKSMNMIDNFHGEVEEDIEAQFSDVILDGQDKRDAFIRDYEEMLERRKQRKENTIRIVERK